MEAVFDHLALSCETLEAGAQAVEAVLGVAPEPGGQHPDFGTHNRLLSLGGLEYLEVIAVDPAASPPGRPRWFDLDRFAGPPRLTNWIVRCDDLEGANPPGEILSLSRGAYRWRMAVPRDGILQLGNLHPAMMAWDGPHPAAGLPESGLRLAEIVLRHPEPERVLAELPPIKEPRLRVERGRPGLHARVTGPRGDAWL